ncbi:MULTISPECIES: MarR family winged helix-turn-helix transcriptional regulator [unclassified Aureispira]|uniref:MarR family winged helix-turn-helix transcriptional regulator n=1 Tax=unclassified Aureispira TaxID=2649989 RepID=UPI000697F17C|nr:MULTISPECIES: MarR family winged helix-turn-helix transcriptional regulator [unclassified Aureispira]WMX15326.1 MarR family winged helix-turn-helix transcriptional regulator [Aureispira sp. CCB-E]
MKNSAFDLSTQNNDFTSKIVAGLERVSEVFRLLLWQHSKVIGLSPIQIQILMFVEYHAEDLCNVSYLAKEFNVSKPTISDAVKVLKKKELIDKHPSAIDKRAYSIVITPAGQAIIAEAKHFTTPIYKLIGALPEQEQEHLFNTLSTLILRLNKTGILEVQRMCYNCQFYTKNEGDHFCNLLNEKLLNTDIRLDCPDFTVKP